MTASKILLILHFAIFATAMGLRMTTINREIFALLGERVRTIKMAAADEKFRLAQAQQAPWHAVRIEQITAERVSAAREMTID